MPNDTNFVHHKLEVYRLALKLLDKVHQQTKQIPRGYRSFADQMLRAAGETAALIGEGANRWSNAQKRQRFIEARGEAGEVAVHTEVLCSMDIISSEKAEEIMQLADSVCAMLTKLIKRNS